MGKIVRGAQVAQEAYVVSVPAVAEQPPPRPGGELDRRFVESHEARQPDESQGGEFFPDDDLFLDADEPAEPAVDVEAVRADARALIDAAAADGEAMLRDAAAKAKALLDAASARVAQIEAEARARGHDEGVAAGRAAAEAELSESVSAMHELVDNVRAQRAVVVESAEPEIVRLAMAIAERIVHDRTATDPNLVVANVRQALTRLVGREVVTLRVNPADHDAIRQHRDAIASSNDVEHVRIVEDQRVDRGGVVVETESGTIDAKIATQLREAKRSIGVHDDEPPVPPAQDSAILHAPAPNTQAS